MFFEVEITGKRGLPRKGKMDVVSDIAFPLPAKVIVEMLSVSTSASALRSLAGSQDCPA